MSTHRRTPLIAGNWKMNGSLHTSHDLVSALATGVADHPHAQMLLCPPAPYLAAVREWVSGTNISVGAQNVSEHSDAGAYTGEVSGAMLIDVGCTHAIVGHSERRSLYGETDEIVARKFAAAQRTGLIPVLCVGETLEQREAGETSRVVARQVAAVADLNGVESFEGAVIAYEPVWAIGTGKTASPAQAQEVHADIRSMLAARNATIAAGLIILYGGSMKAANARELLAMEDIDGGLVGGASLDASEFLQIFLAAAE